MVLYRLNFAQFYKSYSINNAFIEYSISHKTLGYPCSDKGELCMSRGLSVEYEDIYITYSV